MNDSLIERVLTCPRLPTLPAAAVALIDLCRQDDAPVREIAAAISRDPALTAKVLKTVNSAYYGLNRQVTTVSHALVLLGVNTVRTLALGFSLVKLMRDDAGQVFDPGMIWQRSLYSALAARTHAREVGCAAHEEAFLGGLLQDIGILALIQALGPGYVGLLKRSGADSQLLCALERQILQVDHAEIGQRLAEAWNLPPALSTSIRYHEHPEDGSVADPTLVRSVALGNLAASPFLFDEPGDAVRRYLEAASLWFDLDRERAARLLQLTGEAGPEMSRLFELPENEADLDAIMVEANEVMLELSLKVQRQAREASLRAEVLAERAARDPLTGVYNRGTLEEVLAALCARADRTGEGFALLMIDIDRFKQVNDTHGHLIGDRVLAAVAATLAGGLAAEALPAGGSSTDATLARYGGEEFVVLLPATAAAQAAAVAERLRGRIADLHVAADGGAAVAVTASFGVAAWCSAGGGAGARDLVRAADQALYAAKAAGRNRVCAA